MPRSKSKIPDNIPWRMIRRYRKKEMTWKSIGALTGLPYWLLPRWARSLGKLDLLGHAQGQREVSDWKLIARLIGRGKSYDLVAAKVGLKSGKTLSSMIRQRISDGRWTAPLPPRHRRAAAFKGIREKYEAFLAQQ
jgi:hypothetical protein